MPLLMSAFTPKANIGLQSVHVRFGSKQTCALQKPCPLCLRKRTLSADAPHRYSFTIRG